MIFFASQFSRYRVVSSSVSLVRSLLTKLPPLSSFDASPRKAGRLMYPSRANTPPGPPAGKTPAGSLPKESPASPFPENRPSGPPKSPSGLPKAPCVRHAGLPRPPARFRRFRLLMRRPFPLKKPPRAGARESLLSFLYIDSDILYIAHVKPEKQCILVQSVTFGCTLSFSRSHFYETRFFMNWCTLFLSLHFRQVYRLPGL